MALLLAPQVHQSLALHWLTHPGGAGLFSIAVVDSSVIPLPLPGSTDLLLLWLVAHSGDPWLLAPCAVAGSILGGYTTWHFGRRGGEAALRHYVPACLLWRIVGWLERHRILAAFLPALLPLLIPLLPFARLGRTGRFAQALSGGLRRGSQRALILHRLARCGLWVQRRPPVIRNASEVVDSAALHVCGPAGGLRLLLDMEDSRAAQDR
jgi:membrane protein YqaA with SNARE-associated domain